MRVEVRNEVMEKVNKVLYESKLIGYPKPFKNKVRTFCQNPGGFVSQENYDNDLAVVNGHSYKDLKSRQHQPGDPLLPQLHRALQPAHRLRAEGGRADQHAGRRDIFWCSATAIFSTASAPGRRSWPSSNVRPTLPDAVAGDITAAMPYRAMINIINFIQAVDHVVPGFAVDETLLYSPELKFYSNRDQDGPRTLTPTSGACTAWAIPPAGPAA